MARAAGIFPRQRMFAVFAMRNCTSQSLLLSIMELFSISCHSDTSQNQEQLTFYHENSLSDASL